MSSPVSAVTSVPLPVLPESLPEPVSAAEPGKFARRLRELQEADDVKVDGLRPVVTYLRELEVGQASLDGLVAAAMTGKKFSNAELLGLQAAMYQYTIQIDLLSKVIQALSQGLKDLLKMQV